MAKFDFVKQQLYKFRSDNRNLTKEQVSKHFIALGYAKSTVYRWVYQMEHGNLLNRTKSTGRPVKIATKRNIIKLVKHFDHKGGRSQRKFAKSIGCTQGYVSKMLKRNTNIRCFKRFKKPLMTEKQKKEARPKCRKLLEAYRDVDFVIDDESYFTLSHSNISGNDRFYSSNVATTPESIKNKYKTKFEEKLLVWLAMSPKGMSKPFFL